MSIICTTILSATRDTRITVYYFEILEGLAVGLDLIKVNLRIKLNLM